MIEILVPFALGVLPPLRDASPPPGPDPAAARAALLEGVEVLESLGVPGTLSVWGEEAFVVLTGAGPEAVVAGAGYGKGRVLVAAHGAYTNAELLAEDGHGAGRLLRNALRWCGGGETGRVGLVVGEQAAALEAAGFRTLAGLADADGPCDVAILRESTGPEERAEELRAFVEAGGGLLAAECPWGFEQVGATRGWTLREDLLANQVLAPMGIAFAGGYAEKTDAGGYSVTRSQPEAAHLAPVLARLEADGRGAEGLHLVENAIHCVPEAATAFWTRVRGILSTFDPALAPRPSRPLGGDEGAARLYVSWWSRAWRELAVENVPAAPGADEFPGAVPPDAPRAAVEFSLSPDVGGWQGVGRYLPPGEVGAITVLEGAHWRLRVGGHADGLWDAARWARWPEITIERPLPEGETRIASPWGGTVFLIAERDATPLRARLAGTVAAPRYVLGDEESAAAWRVARRAPGPWAELEARHLVLSVPSASIRTLDDPAPVLEFWDSVLLSHCALGGTPPPPVRERFVGDAQISAGYMHAGYPIMTWLDVVTPRADGGPAPVLDLDTLRREGNWGYFHELGHNRQRGEWTFTGTGEVTCNLFSLYTMEKVAGITAWEHPFLAGAKQAREDFFARGAPFAAWQGNPGLALLTYAEVQHEFGWAPFERVFRAYEAMPAAERPRTDQEKIDTWVRLLSVACGHDLRPHHRAWGLPLGEALVADEGLDALPAF